MSVIIRSLEFSNMFSYGANNRLTISGNGITQLVAQNGTGKSSLAIIIQELLYNKNIKGLKKSDILNRYSKSKTWEGKIEFEVDGQEYTVISKRTGASTNVTLLQGTRDISEHKVLDTYKRIADIIGRDFETFSQLTYQSSVDSLEFLKATDTNRKKFLVNLFNLSKYLEIGEKVKVLLSEREKALLKKQGELKTIIDFLENTAIPEYATEIALPEVDSKLAEKIAIDKEALKKQKNFCDEIDRNNLLKKDLASIKFTLDMPEPATSITELLAEINELKSKSSILQSEIKKAQTSIKSLDLSDTCYACKQPIDNTKSKELSDELEKEISELRIKQLSISDAIASKTNQLEIEQTLVKQYEANQKAIDKFTQLSQLINTSIPDNYPDYAQLESEIKKAEIELAWQQKNYTEAVKHNESVRFRNAKIEGLKDQFINFKARQELVNNDIISIQNEITNLSILKKAFSTTGIVAYKLENVTKQLEESINRYLATLSDGQFQVIFRLDGEKLNIIVINNGEEVSVDSLSGGEFSRVQTSVLLAVRNTLSSLGSKSINLLFLDEVMGVLDDSGKERLFEVLAEEKDLSVFLISHEYTNPLIPQIEIEKVNNISKIYN